jgi:3-hydroxyisobutyrate dehydrogenase-like beta-hydroxyacid dehydrogenase
MGLDLSMALSVLTNSAAYSRVMDAKGRKMIDREFTPQAKLSQHLKDVRLILDAGKRGQARLPFSELHQQLLESLESAGCGDLDNSAIIHAFLPDRVHAPS